MIETTDSHTRQSSPFIFLVSFIIGVGPSYCDCHVMQARCSLLQASQEEAVRINAGSGLVSVVRCDAKKVLDGGNNDKDDDNECFLEAYSISALIENNNLHWILCQQAHELIQHSRETFWIDSTMTATTKLCVLERMAWKFFQQHSDHYNLLSDPNVHVYGAEWWVQVKPISYSTALDDDDPTAQSDSKKEAIDLHYDKDEVLAESFGLGVFPTLATVTYLSHSLGASPTVVLSRYYNQPEDKPISTMGLSHPRRGKHIVFDGALLHGAPSHYALREPVSRTNDPASHTAEHRITFLVNLWIGHHPAGVQPLEKSIREALCRVGDAANDDALLASVSFEPKPVPRRRLQSLDDISAEKSRCERIALPFLGKGTTWENENDSEPQTVVSTYAPPHMRDTATTCRFVFGPGLEAFVESLVGENDDDEV
jgi:hypothetical protein